jgi:hypothetical protein
VVCGDGGDAVVVPGGGTVLADHRYHPATAAAATPTRATSTGRRREMRDGRDVTIRRSFYRTGSPPDIAAPQFLPLREGMSVVHAHELDAVARVRVRG